MEYTFTIYDEDGFLTDSIDMGYKPFTSRDDAENEAVKYIDRIYENCERECENAPRGLNYYITTDFKVGDVIVGVFNKVELKVTNIYTDKCTGAKMMTLYCEKTKARFNEPYGRMQRSAFEPKEVN